MSIGRLILLLIVFLSIFRPSYADEPGFEVTATLGRGRIVTRISDEGVAIKHYEDTSEESQPSRGSIFRTSDLALWGIDYERRSTISTNLAARLELKKSELSRAIRSVPGGAALTQ